MQDKLRNKIQEKVKGTGVALVTPFQKNGEIDFEAFDRLLNYTQKEGVDYYVILGTTGESATLTTEEKKQVFQFAANKNQGRLPLVAGMGGNNTNQLLSDLKEYPLAEYDAILSVSPYYNRPSQEGIFAHYKAVSKASPLPIILYNVPSRTGTNIEAETTLRLARECENIIGIKEASSQFEQFTKILSQKPQNFQVIAGDDALAVPMISIGAAGLISVLANSHPKECSEMVSSALNGDFTNAQKLHLQLSSYIPLLFKESNPVGVKLMLALKGICEENVRLPLVNGSESLRSEIKNLFKIFS
jgi:4-hydroxy-tetrahydrodipicolinate synthase